ncbi:cation-transporting P-type ATPase, partial [Ochrobactrum sp. MR28]|nr:cation-transporting P-type ATPase [Ochrobactrum sp. MR28]
EVTLHDVYDVKTIPSAGIVGRDMDGPIWAGNRRMAHNMGALLDDERFKNLQDGAETVVYLGRGALVLGAISIADKVR